VAIMLTKLRLFFGSYSPLFAIMAVGVDEHTGGLLESPTNGDRRNGEV